MGETINEEIKEKEIIHEFKPSGEKRKINIFLYFGVILTVFLGVITGYYLGQSNKKISFEGTSSSSKGVKSGGKYGVINKNFKDVAEGRLEKGGIDGEGSHHLVRPGGESQNVYLTSSVINLDDFVGKKVRVWGETFAAQKAGWLMDVGRIEVLK